MIPASSTRHTSGSNCEFCREKHRSLKKHFQNAMKSLKQVLLPEDMSIADAVLSTEKHCTVDELHQTVAKEHPEVTTTHVRRTLGLLCDLGIVRKMLAAGQHVYEHIHLDEHHDHFICLRCGKIIEFSDSQIEARQLERAKEAGFHPLFHRLEIKGLCASCANGTRPVKTLEQALPDETVWICDLLGGRGFMTRLSEMGLTRGTPIRVLQNDRQVVVDVRGSRVGIAHGLAGRIIVSTEKTNGLESAEGKA